MKNSDKRRVAIFSTGLVIGTLASMILWNWAQGRDAPPVRMLDVVLSTCELVPETTLSEECVEVRPVPYHLTPPEVLTQTDLDWHIGRVLRNGANPGDALRLTDFHPI